MTSVHVHSSIVLLGLLAAMSAAIGAEVLASPLPSDRTEAVVANDNRHAAGTLDHGRLMLRLRAARGTWQPEGPAGPALSIEALGETSAPLTVPAPMIRVEEGTVIVASVRNELGAALRVHGLCAREAATCEPLDVPPGQTREVRFASGRPGTYHYWATTMGAPVPFREMAGALIVDPPGGPLAPDRVFVITEWSSLTPQQLRAVVAADDSGVAFAKLQPGVAFMINGLSWPATERLRYQLGESVHWRVINLSSQAHPMHLHGFYFEVDSLGDGVRDMPVDAQTRHPVVTELLRSGETMALTWLPERVGNWLFHCHIMHHVSPERRLTAAAPSGNEHGTHHGAHHGGHDAGAGMAGMILGVTVVPSAGTASVREDDQAARKLTLVMTSDLTTPEPALGFTLSGDGVPPVPAPGVPSAPGPAIVLRRGDPVEITVVNRLGEATALHWHGIELDSYYDGVHGWSGDGQGLAPLIEPDRSFVVRFTPPRAGTFMYHTHLHDERQLPLGLYGPVIVVEPGETFDSVTDHVLIVARKGLDPAAPNVLIPATPVVLNGLPSPQFVWKAGERHRVRLINITPDDIFNVALQTARGPMTWTPVAKDGATLPESLRQPRPAQQTIAVGETYDFAVDLAPGPANVWIEVRSTAGKWQAQGHAIVR